MGKVESYEKIVCDIKNNIALAEAAHDCESQGTSGKSQSEKEGGAEMAKVASQSGKKIIEVDPKKVMKKKQEVAAKKPKAAAAAQVIKIP